MHGTDLELLRRYTEASDAEALAELVARNRDMVYAACYRVLGRRGDAEDAAQECFLQLAQSAGAVKVSVAGWLHRVAVRTALAMQRKSRARGKAEREAAIMLAGTRAEATWDDIKAEVDKAIDRLPVHLREPLALYFLQGRTQAATAQEIGVSQQAVSMRLKEAIERLRGHLRRSGLAVTVAGLTVLLETHAAEAAPATLVASLGKIALAGIAPAPAKAGVAGSVLGVAAAMGPGAKVLCVVAISLAAGVAIHQAAESRDTPRELPAVSLAAPEAFSDQLPANPPVNAVPTSPPPRSELLSAMSAADAADASRRRPNQSAHAPKAAESGRKLQPAADHGKPPVRMRPPADARPPAEADTLAADEAPKAVAGPIGVGHLAQLPGADGDQKPGGQMSAFLSPTGAVEFMDEEGVVATLWLIGFGPTWNPGDQRRAFVGFPIPGGGEWATFAGEIEVPQVEGARVLYKQRSRPTDAGLELEYDVTVSDDMKFSGVRLALRLPVERLAGDAVVIEAADGELRTVTLRERRGAPALDHMDGCQIDVSPDPEPLLSVHLVLPFEATIGVQDLRIYGLDEYGISIMIRFLASTPTQEKRAKPGLPAVTVVGPSTSANGPEMVICPSALVNPWYSVSGSTPSITNAPPIRSPVSPSSTVTFTEPSMCPPLVQKAPSNGSK